VLSFFLALLGAARVYVRSRSATALEILALYQQVAVLKRRWSRPRLNPLDRFERVFVYSMLAAFSILQTPASAGTHSKRDQGVNASAA
jgi:hypothetical protein